MAKRIKFAVFDFLIKNCLCAEKKKFAIFYRISSILVGNEKCLEIWNFYNFIRILGFVVETINIKFMINELMADESFCFIVCHFQSNFSTARPLKS